MTTEESEHEPNYEARVSTHEHIAQVRGLVLGAAIDLQQRAHRHDRTKLLSPEVEVFDEATAELKQLTYGSPAYKQALEKMGPALEHHYEVWDHHPEHHAGGIQEMDLIQILEMLCDWIAATRRHTDGDIRRSIEQNAERFGYGPEIKRLLHNTVKVLEHNEVVP